MKLYELTADYVSILEAIENGDIPEEAIADTLDAITGEINEKADSIACVLKNLDAEISAIKAEEDRLAYRRKAKQAAYERLETYISETLRSANIDKLETARNKITFRRSEKVFCSEEFLQYAIETRSDLLTYPSPKPSLSAIKDALKQGEDIPGAMLQTSYNIQIK